MLENYNNLLKEIKLKFNDKTLKTYLKYEKFFKTFNQHTNLISQKDSELFFEKHFYDSLAINLFFEKMDYSNKKSLLLDIGTGGGFPSVPISIFFPLIQVYALDSILKKINFIEEIKKEFDLNNLHPTRSRVEDLPKTFNNLFDIITSRAVGKISLLAEYSAKYIKRGGYLIAYKSINYEEELLSAKKILEKNHLEKQEIIEYQLPTEEKHKRFLIVFKKIK